MSLPLVAAPPAVAVLLNVALWAGAQIGAGYAAHRLTPAQLDRPRRILGLRRFEQGGRWYERRLRISRWKDRVPEAGAYFAGGVSKRSIGGRTDDDLELFRRETKRAELAHWWSFLPLPLCLIWNPAAGAALMTAYGICVNLPMVAIQRYNRARIERILARRSAVG